MASVQHPLWHGKGESTTVVGIDEIRMMLNARKCPNPNPNTLTLTL